MADGIEIRYCIPTAMKTNLLKIQDLVNKVCSEKCPDFAKGIVSEKNWTIMSKEYRRKYDRQLPGEESEKSEVQKDSNYLFEEMCFIFAFRAERSNIRNDKVTKSFMKSLEYAVSLEDDIRKSFSKSPKDDIPGNKRKKADDLNEKSRNKAKKAVEKLLSDNGIKGSSRESNGKSLWDDLFK